MRAKMEMIIIMNVKNSVIQKVTDMESAYMEDVHAFM